MFLWRRTLSLVYILTFTNKANAVYIPSMAAHISITDENSESVAIDYLKSGSVIAVPTDTVYGLACDATNASAIAKLYTIKGRHEDKPIAICLSDIFNLKSWAVTEHLPKNLLKALLPGPVTIILKCANPILDKSLCLEGKVGIRIPDYSFIRNLSRGLGKPLALTSANLSNNPSAVETSEFSVIWDRISAVFDGGRLQYNNSASTIVDLSQSGVFQVVRKGAAYEETLNILKKFALKNKY